jgi:hypothetical protein
MMTALPCLNMGLRDEPGFDLPHPRSANWLLNEVREALEEIIDRLHEPQIGKKPKPRTYRNRENIHFCKLHGIRFSGPPLGRPTKDAQQLKEQLRQERQDTGIRSAVEEKFGEGKRIYGLNLIFDFWFEKASKPFPNNRRTEAPPSHGLSPDVWHSRRP